MRTAAAPPASITARVEQLRRIDGEVGSPTPPAPRSAKIELTSRCNFACTFCASRLRAGPQRDMPWSAYVAIAAGLRAAGVTQLGLFYIGESFLYPRLEAAVRYAKQELGFPYVFLTTNGSLASGDRVRALLAAGLDSLKFALNFATGAQLARSAGTRAAHFDAIVGNVLAACDARDAHERATGRRCLVSASSLRYDEHQAGRMHALLAALAARLDQHYWLPPFGRPQTWASAADAPAGGSAATVRKPLPCWPLFTEAHVTADGSLSACSLDHSPRFRIGDLARQPFMDVWHAAPFQALRAAHLAGDACGTACADCVGY